MCRLAFVTLKQPRHIWEEKTSVAIISPSHWPVGKVVGTFSWLMFDLRGPGHCRPCHAWRAVLYKKADR